MNIVIFGHQNWGKLGIQTLLELDHSISHVFTHPLDMDKNEKIWYDSLDEICTKNSIPISERSKILDDDFEIIQKLEPKLILSLGWRRLIPEKIFSIPKFGTINIHDSLLPNYRGFAPVNWCIINGEKSSGITAHYLDADADTGDIVLQESIPVLETDTAKMVFDKLMTIYPNFLKKLLHQIDTNTIISQPQNNLEGFTCSKRLPKDGKINWLHDRTDIFNLIRALSDPYPNSFFIYNNEKIFIKKCELVDEDFRGPPGRICKILRDGIIVTCGTNTKSNQALKINKISVNDKVMKANSFFTKLWVDLK